ncbi:hypothetical protein GQ457_04G038450 [Hibiscus cannabinus]
MDQNENPDADSIIESEISVLPNTISGSQPSDHRRELSFSISTPLETVGDDAESKSVRFQPQPMPEGEADDNSRKPKHTNFNSFKTMSGKLERQFTSLRGRSRKSEAEEDPAGNSENEAMPMDLPVDRYFDALKGPELESLKSSEEIVLPDDKTWPFLLRFPISSFGMCLGISSQAIMWKALATAPSTSFLNINLTVNLILWWISVAVVATVSSMYLLKVILYFEAVRREYYHPIRVNFFFAPWVALLFLALGVPPSVASSLPVALWYVLMTPLLCLELKIYGQWMSGGQRRLSKVANPSNHLSVVGNFVGSLLGASMGLKEGPTFFFAVGLAHYIVLFVTLYQRLPTNDTLPKELHPVFFLFVAAPSVASMAWATIQGSFGYGSRIAYFIALFLYFSLAVRVNFFRGIKYVKNNPFHIFLHEPPPVSSLILISLIYRFSLAWWAYTFPMSSAAIATMRYSSAVTNLVTQTLAVILSLIATLMVTSLLVTTILHAFVLQDLFPNDIAIAISDQKPEPRTNWLNLIPGSSECNKDIETFLKFANADSKDIEAAVDVSTAEAK